MGVTIPIPEPVSCILKRLEARGFRAYAVGGCVRDSLLGRTPKDWDLCTSALPAQTAASFPDARTVLTGERYGTVTVIWEDQPYEITTFRRETGYEDGRHPDQVDFVPELREDLARRDFTVNAMGADREGRVTDCFSGLEDLKKGLIRCVGHPEARFREDALRILRGLRFAARLGFSIEEETGRAIGVLAPSLTRVAPERLSRELTGLLCGRNAAQVLRAYPQVAEVLIPELRPAMGFCQQNPHHLYDVWEHSLRVLEAVPPEPVLRLGALLHDAGKPGTFTLDENQVGHFYGHAQAGAAMTETILRRLRFDSKTVRGVTELVALHHRPIPGTVREMARLLGKVGEETVRQLICLHGADVLGTGTGTWTPEDTGEALALLEEAQKTCFSRASLRAGGRELLALGLKPGPELGRLLDEILEEVQEGRLANERDEIVRYAQNRISGTG